MEYYNIVNDTLSINETLGAYKGEPWVVIDPFKLGLITTSGTLKTNSLDTTIYEVIERHQNRKNDYAISKDGALVAIVYKTDMFQYVNPDGTGLYKLALDNFLHLSDKVNNIYGRNFVWYIFFKEFLHVNGIYNKTIDDPLTIVDTVHFSYGTSLSDSFVFTDALIMHMIWVFETYDTIIFNQELDWTINFPMEL